MKLEELGYKLVHKYYRPQHEYPSEHWEKVSMHGWWVNSLIFDTAHGGPWTFECGLSIFRLRDESDWTTQELFDFNPSSHAFIGAHIGHWVRETPVLTADECRAIADHICDLERERLQLREDA